MGGALGLAIILIVHLHTSPTEHPTPPTIVVHLKEVEGHKDTLHSDGQQRKIFSHCALLHACICACTNACMYTYMCVCLCVCT